MGGLGGVAIAVCSGCAWGGAGEYVLPGEFVVGGMAAMAYGWPVQADPVEGHERIALRPWPVKGLAAVVPLRPMVGGLAVNTILLSLAWFLVLSPLVALRVLRRGRRVRRNRCAGCGHSVAGLPNGAPCTECGRGLRERTTLAELLTARAPMAGAAMALILVLVSSAVLLMHRWMAVDRLPPLHQAAAVGDVDAIERLIAGGTAVDGPMGRLNSVPVFPDQATPLYWAASRGHVEASSALLDRGADPAVDIFGYQPVRQAIGTGDAAIAELLMSALQPGDQLLAVEEVFVYAHQSIQRQLLDRVLTTEHARLELASRAIIQQDLPLLDALVDDGLSSGGRHWMSLLSRAVLLDSMAYERPYRKDLGQTRHVLGLGLDIHPAEAKLAVRDAMRFGCLPALETLLGAYPQHAALARGLDGDDLADAAMRGGSPALTRLIELGANPNAPGRQGFNALLPASMAAAAEAVAILLEGGVDPTLVDGTVTLRQWLLAAAERAGKNPRHNPAFPSLTDPIAFERILNLLEAAEAEWDAREGFDAGAAGGP